MVLLRSARLRRLSSTALTLAVCASGLLVAATSTGVLDQPLDEDPTGQSAATPALTDAVIDDVRDEQEQLETLPTSQLEPRARSGERAAQVALGVDFAKEADSLGFAPAAANAALGDAARWYEEAAKAQFPGAPPLEGAGVRFYPIRVQR